jgi:hypothetical protein
MGWRGRAPTRSRPAAETPLSSAGTVVGCGSLAAGHHSHESIGGKPRPVPASGCDRPARILLPGVPCRSPQRPHGQSVSEAEGPLGNSVGAIGWPRGIPPLRSGVGAGPPRSRAGRSRPRSLLATTLPSGACGSRAGPPSLRGGRTRRGCTHDSYLVDSASSHMLVSKIKPCMSKYKQLYCETANGSLNQLSFI